MKIHKVLQGTDEWHAVRRDCDGTASEAAVMMGDSKFMMRDELLKMKSTGLEKEISRYTQLFLFDKGHKAEADIMSVIEAQIGEELYPLTGSIEIEGLKLLASFDGLTMSNRVVVEHKLLNEELAQRIDNNDVPASHYWQLEQELLVSGAEYVIFSCSDGTEDSLHKTRYISNPRHRKALIAGWKQFKIDLANYVHEEVKNKPEPDVIESFPALIVNIEGTVKSSNLELYKTTAMAFIENINTELKTDDDFANAESTVKFCAAVEKELDEVKRRALSQTQSIDELFRTVDTLQEEYKKKRLTLTKLVKSEKDNVKRLILNDAAGLFNAHIDSLIESIGIHFDSEDRPDFVGAMKNKRTIESIKNAINTELARVKISNNESAEMMRKNLLVLDERGKDYKFLFNDLMSIVGHKNDAFSAIVNERISAHKAKEERKLEAERERIREEEKKKVEEKAQREKDEVERKAKAERERIEQEEQDALEVSVTTPVSPGESPEKTYVQAQTDVECKSEDEDGATLENKAIDSGVDIHNKMQSLMYVLTKDAARSSYAEYLKDLGITDEDYEEIKKIWKDKLGIEPYV